MNEHARQFMNKIKNIFQPRAKNTDLLTSVHPKNSYLLLASRANISA